MTDEELNGRFDGIDKRFDGIDKRFDGIDKRFEAVDNRFDALEARLVEAMRDMQTELLRGFEAFSTSLTLRLRKVEADQSNLDASLSGRVEVLERRLLQIEQRLGGAK